MSEFGAGNGFELAVDGVFKRLTMHFSIVYRLEDLVADGLSRKTPGGKRQGNVTNPDAGMFAFQVYAGLIAGQADEQ